jgi:Fe(3+) dicitrate transport protein
MISRIYTKLIEEISPLMLVSALILTSILFTLNTSAEASMEVESVTIIGTKEDVKDLAGSGAVISNEDLEKAMDTDIAKILSAIPGNVYAN